MFYLDIILVFFFSVCRHYPFLFINLFLVEVQVICWVLGEYGTAGGKYSASYITGKLCDVAEALSSNDTVKVSSLRRFCLYWLCQVFVG